MTTSTSRRPRGLVIVGVFAFIAGLGEMVVGYTGNYLGILEHSISPSLATAVVGLFYSLGGVFLLVTKKKWGAILAIVSLACEILGRIYLVTTGVAPAQGADALKIVIGGLIAVALIAYIIAKRKSFE